MEFNLPRRLQGCQFPSSLHAELPVMLFNCLWLLTLFQCIYILLYARWKSEHFYFYHDSLMKASLCPSDGRAFTGEWKVELSFLLTVDHTSSSGDRGLFLWFSCRMAVVVTRATGHYAADLTELMGSRVLMFILPLVDMCCMLAGAMCVGEHVSMCEHPCRCRNINLQLQMKLSPFIL